MDQEAEIMKQSMARQEAAQEAAADEEEPGRPLRSVSSGARGDVSVRCRCSLVPLLQAVGCGCGIAKPKRWILHMTSNYFATSGNRTPPNCLEGNYANHYTNAAVQRKSGCKLFDVAWLNLVFIT